MSLPKIVTNRCVACGRQSSQTILASTNRFGSPDLDMRPPEMMRSTMRWWIQECPHCGYVAEDIGDSCGVATEWLKSEVYKTCDGRSFKSDLAARFYKNYLTNLVYGSKRKAFYAALHAAWACDDAQDVSNAIHCRSCALQALDKMTSTPRVAEELLVVKADLLRRTERFDNLIEEYQSIRLRSDLLNQIIAFEVERAKANDTARYTVDDVNRLNSNG